MLHEALKKYFGFEAFREGQEAVIRAALGKRDALLVMPTGSGKSLCFQLTALMLPGTTLVVSPLIALMKDQVDALERRGIPATFLNSSVDADEMGWRLDQLKKGRYKLVYIAPERFRNQRFLQALEGACISMLTIDEAHCISQWGHDFRPDYLHLQTVVRRLPPETRVMAVTATATEEVRKDICRQLCLGEAPRGEPLVLVTGFSRPNLYLTVRPVRTHAQKLQRVAALIDMFACGIVYCATRKMAERVCVMLRECGAEPLLYHGALSDAERISVQDAFMRAEKAVVVATNAFGMGVDRPDIRFVAHWDVPGSIEAYYQEVGRAGRDGAFAWCELLYTYADVRTQQFFLDGANPAAEDIYSVYRTVQSECADGAEAAFSAEEWAQRAGLKNDMAVRSILGMLERAALIERELKAGQRIYTTRLAPKQDLERLKRLCAHLHLKRSADEGKLQAMLGFVSARGCRHRFLLAYFGETSPQNRCVQCDVCSALPERLSSPAPLGAAEALLLKKALSGVGRMNARFTLAQVIQVVRGEEHPFIERHALRGLSTYGLLKEHSAAFLESVYRCALFDGLIRLAGGETHSAALTARGRDWLFDRLPDEPLRWPGKEKPATGPVEKPRPLKVPVAGDTQGLERKITQWAVAEAERRNLPRYAILHKKTILALTAAMPGSTEALQEIPGLGDIKIARYGRQILRLLHGSDAELPGLEG